MVVHDVAVLVAHADGDGLVVAARRQDLAQGAADVGVGGPGRGARRQRGEGGEAGEEREQAGARTTREGYRAGRPGTVSRGW